MMLQRIFLLAVVLVFRYSVGMGQRTIGENIPLSYSASGTWVDNPPIKKTFVLQKQVTGFHSSNRFQLPGTGLPLFSSYSPVAPDYYSRHLSFFCRTEWRIEKITAVPFRFRLGSLQYTDWLEGKPNAMVR